MVSGCNGGRTVVYASGWSRNGSDLRSSNKASNPGCAGRNGHRELFKHSESGNESTDCFSNNQYSVWDYPSAGSLACKYSRWPSNHLGYNPFLNANGANYLRLYDNSIWYNFAFVQ